MLTPPPIWRARAPAFLNFARLAARRLFVGACVGAYLVTMTWMLWRTR